MIHGIRARQAYVMVVMCCVVMAVHAANGPKIGSFRLPEYDDNGVKKSEVIGESATVVDGIAEITNFQVEFYDDDGSNVEMRITAPHCRYDQKNKIARSDGSVQIVGDKIVVTGDEFALDRDKELFQIFRNSRVVLKGAGERVEKSREVKDQGE